MPEFQPSILRNTVAAVALVAFAAGSTLASEREIGWTELAPEAAPYANPFEDLTSDQIKDLRTVLIQQPGDDAQSPDTAPAVKEAMARLEASGLDVEYLARQREIVIEKRIENATATNAELTGHDVKISGYMLPLHVEGDKVTEFLLVPTVGACIHTPAPPPNQLIYVRYPSGFHATGLFTPVWTAGRLDASQTVQNVGYVDGRLPVEVAYKLEASDVVLY